MKKIFLLFNFISLISIKVFSQITMPGFSVGGPTTTGGSGIVNTVTVTTNAGVSGTSSGGANPALTISLGKITPSAVTIADSARIGTTQYCPYPFRVKENSTGGGIKIGNNLDDGGDHQSALNINLKHTSSTGAIYRSLKIEDEWQAQQYWNMWQGVFTQRFTGTSTYSQAGGAPAPYQCGNLILGLEGTNPNVTIPNYIYQGFMQPGYSANTGNFAGTLGDLYYIYCQDLTAGANNYLWYSGSGKFRLGDKLWNTAPNLAHGMTSFIPTNTYYEQTIGNATNGGLVINSATSSGSVTPTAFNAISGATPTVPCFIFNGGKKLNTSYTSLASTEIHTEFRNGGSATPIIQILANGHMGIGATSPASMLTITQGAGETTQALKINANSGNSSAAIYIDQQNATGRGLLFNMVSTSVSDYISDFRVGGTSKVYFAGDGTVGISQDVPTAKLHVVSNGATSSSYALKINDSGNDTLLHVRSDGAIMFGSNGTNSISGDAATINQPTGSFVKDNSGTTFTLTNSLITAKSKVFLQLVTTGITTGYQITPQVGSGTCTITFETAGVAAAPNADATVNFWVVRY